MRSPNTNPKIQSFGGSLNVDASFEQNPGAAEPIVFTNVSDVDGWVNVADLRNAVILITPTSTNITVVVEYKRSMNDPDPQDLVASAAYTANTTSEAYRDTLDFVTHIRLLQSGGDPASSVQVSIFAES